MSCQEPVNVLMVDDQPGKLLTYEAILRPLGENLLKANSGREALECLLKTDVAVVLMDVSMPEMDGFQLADMIRQHPRFERTAIIFISAVHLTDLDRLKAYERGAVDYISVPVVPALLRAKVSVFAELYRKTRQLDKLNRDLERRIAERTEELRESENQFRSLANSIPQLAWMANPDGSVVWFNQRWYEYTGTTIEEINGRGWKKLIHPDHVARVIDGMQHCWSSGSPWEDTFPLVGKDGSGRWFLCRALPLRDANGQIARWFATSTDITERKLAEDALVKSERLAAMGRLAGIIAHEINNPLETIMNALYVIRDHRSLDEEARNYCRLAEEEMSRVTQITRQALSFYRESERPTSISLVEILDSVVELQSRRLQLNGITVAKRYRTEGKIQGSPGELKQVFLNIVGNAIQAMPEGGHLRIRLHPSLDRLTRRLGIRVSVCDTGLGIRPEHAKRIFEPFFSTKEAKGTGLGLWISKTIIQKHDGSIRFRSLRLGNKSVTCFSVLIPAVGTSSTNHTASALVA